MEIDIILSKKTVKFYKKILSIIISSAIILSLFIFFKYSFKFKNIIPNINKVEINSSNDLSEETIVNKIRNVNKLIPLEVELSETITIDNTYFDLDIFKKVKKITYFSTCSYSIDFSTLTNEQVNLNNSTKEIFITIPQPKIFSIDIDESKTVYNEPELGLLRFGDLNLSSEDLKILYEKLYESFSKKMNDKTLYNQAILNTQSSLESLISNLTNEDYTVILSIYSN